MKRIVLSCFIVSLLFAVTGCGLKGLEKEITKGVTENEKEQEEYSGAFTQKCTVDNIVFYVGESWIPIEDQDGGFLTEDSKAAYMLVGVSPLGSFTPEEFYEGLMEEYERMYTIQEKDDSLSPFVTADSLDAMIANVQMEFNGNIISVDILIVPQKNIVLTFSGQCKTGDELPVDVRRITETTTIDIGTKDYVSGNQFLASDGSELWLQDDGTFLYYLDADDHDYGYITGTYYIYYGQEAIDAIVGMTEYGLTEEELESVLAQNMNGYVPGGNSLYQAYQYFSGDEKNTEQEEYHVCKDTFYAMEVYNKEMVIGDEVTEAAGNRVLYMGYYLSELEMMDMLNANTTNYTQWTLKKE